MASAFTAKSSLLVLAAIFLVGASVTNAQGVEDVDYETEEEQTVDTPEFVTEGGTVKAQLGERLKLICQLNTQTDIPLIWKKGENNILALSDKQVLTKDSRFHFRNLEEAGMSMTIDDFSEADVGLYRCQLAVQSNIKVI